MESEDQVAKRLNINLNFGIANTNWHEFKEHGAFFCLDEGFLCQLPQPIGGGFPKNYDKTTDVTVVDFTLISDDEVLHMCAVAQTLLINAREFPNIPAAEN